MPCHYATGSLHNGEDGYWNGVYRPKETRALHRNFVSKRIQDVTDGTKSYKAWTMVCSRCKFENEDDRLSLVPDFTVVKLIMCLAGQKGYQDKHIDFQNAFLNGIWIARYTENHER